MSRHFGGIAPVRRNDKSRYVIILSAFMLVVCGFVAIVFLASGPSTANQQQVPVIQEPQIETSDVLIPVQKIEQGTALEPSMFRKEKRPRVGLSASVVREFEQIQGYYASSMIVPDQPLHNEYVTKVRPINDITQRIPEGYRAVTIRTDAKTSVEGWVAPGTRVDVVWATQIQGKQAIQVIVENALVLSADKMPENSQQKNPAAAAPSTVTLQVTTEDAKKVQLASISGSLSLSLRGDRDTGRAASTAPLTIDGLLGRTNSSAPQAPTQVCHGKVKTCTKDGMCEELCLSEDGKLSPMIAK